MRQERFWEAWAEKLKAPDEGVPYFRNIIVQFFLGAALVFLVMGWVLPYVFVSRARELVILHYNVYFGVDVVGAYEQLYLAPAIGASLLALNLWLGHLLYTRSRERIAAYILLAAGMIIELGVAIGSGALALVNY